MEISRTRILVVERFVVVGAWEITVAKCGGVSAEWQMWLVFVFTVLKSQIDTS